MISTQLTVSTLLPRLQHGRSRPKIVRPQKVHQGGFLSGGVSPRQSNPSWGEAGPAWETRGREDSGGRDGGERRSAGAHQLPKPSTSLVSCAFRLQPRLAPTRCSPTVLPSRRREPCTGQSWADEGAQEETDPGKAKEKPAMVFED